MTDWLLEELAAARRARTSCALVTVAATKGSVPRAAGSKMLVYTNGKASGTIGGGKFESLVIKDAQLQIRAKKPLLLVLLYQEGRCVGWKGFIGSGSIQIPVAAPLIAPSPFYPPIEIVPEAPAKLVEQAKAEVLNPALAVVKALEPVPAKPPPAPQIATNLVAAVEPPKVRARPAPEIPKVSVRNLERLRSLDTPADNE